MKVVFDAYLAGEEIPAALCLRNKKLVKFFNRESGAAVVAAGRLLGKNPLLQDTPFYYATGFIEYEDYGLAAIVEDSLDENGRFSERLFIEKGLSRISPLNQFKVLQNMPLCFISIVYCLKGDNAVIYGSGRSLLQHALYSPHQGQILLGAGKVYEDGRAEAGFALVSKSEIARSPFLSCPGEAVDIFRSWAEERNA